MNYRLHAATILFSILLSLVIGAAITGRVFAQVSTEHKLAWYVMDSGGGIQQSASHKIIPSAGQVAGDTSSSANFQLLAGFIGKNQWASSSGGDDYELDDTCDRATALDTMGTKQVHNFHDQGDKDWIRFTAQAGKTYIIEVKNTGSEADAVIALYDTCALPPSGSGTNAFGSTVTLAWDSIKNGDYFVRLQQFDPSFYGEDTGYEVSIRIDDVPPSAPKNPRCIAIDATTLGIQWDRSPERDVKSYRIPYTGTPSGNADVDGADSTYYELGGLPTNHTYNFRIVALDNSNNESLPSGAVECVTQEPEDTSTPSLALAQPTGSTYTTASSKLTFSGSAQDSGGNLSRVHVQNVSKSTEGWDNSLSGGSSPFRVTDVPIGIGDNNVKITVYDAAGNTSTQNVTVKRTGEASGGVLIVAGHNETFGLQPNIHNAANRAYRIFKSAGFTDDDIYYIAPETSLDADGDGSPDVDAASSPAAVQNAITTWAKARVGPDKPFFIYMIDHGFLEKYCANGCTSGFIAPDTMDGWLSQLETDTGVDEVTVVIEACQSGSFLDKLDPGKWDSLSRNNRIVITSTGRENNAYASAQGAYFSDAFFSCIADSNNLKVCYDEGVAAVQVTGNDQTPWLDDNGDNLANQNDGTVAAERYVTRFFSSIRPRIISTELQQDGANGTLLATVAEGAEPMDVVWATIYPPSFEEPTGVTLNLGVPTVRLEPDPDTPNLYSFEYINGFTEEGDYRIIFYAQDRLGVQALPKLAGESGLVYLPALHRQVTVEAQQTDFPEHPFSNAMEWDAYIPWVGAK